MNGDLIVAGPNTLTGSIGVIGGWVYNRSFGEKLGMTSDHVQIGHHADLAAAVTLPFLGLRIPYRNLTSEERSTFESLIRNIYHEFIGKVTIARSMTVKEVKSVAQGRVWSGQAAKERGLVDLIGTLETAITAAKEAAGIPTDREVDLVHLPEKGWFKPAFLNPQFTTTLWQEKPNDWTWTYLNLISRNRIHPLVVLPPDLILEREGIE
jgi:protease-4